MKNMLFFLNKLISKFTMLLDMGGGGPTKRKENVDEIDLPPNDNLK